MEEKVFRDAILFGLASRGSETADAERSLDELARLLDTAGGSVFARVLQVKESPDPRTLIGSGKVKEIRQLAENNGITLAVFDGELSPAQIRNLEDDLGGTVNASVVGKDDLKIVSRTAKAGE